MEIEWNRVVRNLFLSSSLLHTNHFPGMNFFHGSRGCLFRSTEWHSDIKFSGKWEGGLDDTTIKIILYCNASIHIYNKQVDVLLRLHCRLISRKRHRVHSNNPCSRNMWGQNRAVWRLSRSGRSFLSKPQWSTCSRCDRPPCCNSW